MEFRRRCRDSRYYVIKDGCHSQSSFFHTVVPKLQCLGVTVSLPEGELAGGDEFSEKRFGVQMVARGKSWGDVYTKLYNAEKETVLHCGSGCVYPAISTGRIFDPSSAACRI